MENGQQTIRELFSGEKHFIIPKFQRAYTWEDKQRKDFLDDIRNQREDKQYFLGTILFQSNKEMKDGFEQINIVDGQQRIITTAIFSNVILTLLKEKDKEKDYSREIRRYVKDKDVYKLEIACMDNEFFKTYILDNVPFSGKFTTPSQKRLFQTKQFFHNELVNSNAELLKNFIGKLERSRVLTYSVNDTAEATLIFETTNDRGKALTNLEKTKSFLMHKVYLARENPLELIDSVQDRFSEIYRILEEIESKIENEDSVLQYHFIGHFDWKKTKDYQAYVDKLKERINVLMEANDNENTATFIDNYSRELRESFGVVREIVNDHDSSLRNVFILERMSIFYPLLIKCYKLDKSVSKNDYYNVVRLLEIISFRVYGIGGKRVDTGRDWLYTLARDFGGNFKNLKADIKDGILSYVNDTSFKEKLSSPLLYEDFKNGPDLKYLLWKYENHLRTNEQPKASEMSEQEFLTQNPKNRLTVEHIASQTPRVSVSRLKIPRITEKFEEQYLHRLGNLTFAPNSVNASMGNNSIKIKNSKYFVKAPFKIQNELDEFIIKGTWDKESILKRECKMLNFALELWDPRKITTDMSEVEKAPEDTHISENKEKHKKVFAEIVARLKSKFSRWSKSLNAILKYDFYLYQQRDGNLTCFTLAWEYDDAVLEIQGGVFKEKDAQQYHYVEVFTRKKSERLKYNLEQESVLELFRQADYKDISVSDGKPYFSKKLNVMNDDKDRLVSVFEEEINKLKPIVEKIII